MTQEKIDNPYLKAKEFHQTFDPVAERQQLLPLECDHATNRANLKIEELVEFVYAAANNDQAIFDQSFRSMHQALDQARSKIQKKQKEVSDPLVEEIDALVDLLYFTYGTFVYLGIDPTEIFECVHQANMGKLFPDGRPRYDERTGKVLKPENWENDFAPEGRIRDIIAKYQEKRMQNER